jgi:hypothetical protein
VRDQPPGELETEHRCDPSNCISFLLYKYSSSLLCDRYVSHSIFHFLITSVIDPPSAANVGYYLTGANSLELRCISDALSIIGDRYLLRFSLHHT